MQIIKKSKPVITLITFINLVVLASCGLFPLILYRNRLISENQTLQ